jgi:hypothetical protein
MRRCLIVLAVASAAVLDRAAPATRQVGPDEPPWQQFLAAASADARRARPALDDIAARWRNEYAAMLVDILRFLPPPAGGAAADDELQRTVFEEQSGQRTSSAGSRRDLPLPVPPSPAADSRRRLVSFLERHTRQRFGDDFTAWRKWTWALPDNPHPDYASFKAELYARIDPRFRAFFPPRVRSTIRLDEIEWGGVLVNGIPPLRSPKTVSAAEARWLRDGHIVFGIVVDGQARAYPKRILAWHEMAIDRLGGVDLTVVYCTLCGTVIPYESRSGGRHFTFGTSGLLYRSNKLMFDEETRSLWSSLEGVPVVGSLAGSRLRLSFRSVVTTTWGEWKRDYPATTVLSLETGHTRNYAEGAAYRDYFATDDLMFDVPRVDTRLRNKADVLVVRPETLGSGALPVAIAVERLRREPVYAFDAAGRGFVVVTSRGGANRLYERGSHTFVGLAADRAVRDATGRRWTITPDALVSEAGERLDRVPAHRAFWFGWVAQYPHTLLHK